MSKSQEMIIKFIVVSSFLCGTSLGFTINCLFYDELIENKNYYTCELQSISFIDQNCFASITGDHLEGRNNFNITAILVSKNIFSSVNTSLICSQFKNIARINIFNNDELGIRKITFIDCFDSGKFDLYNNSSRLNKEDILKKKSM